MKSLPVVLVLSGLLTIAAYGAEQDPIKVGTFLQETARSFHESDGLPSKEVLQIHISEEGPVAVTDQGVARFTGTRWEPRENHAVQSYCIISEAGIYRLVECGGDAPGEEAIPVRQVACQEGTSVAAATKKGLFVRNDAGQFEKVTAADDAGRHWGVEDVRGVALDAEGRLWFATLAGAACKGENGWEFFTGDEGLPYNDFTCMAAGKDGSVWFGTTRGAIRYKDGAWRYRQGRRWLPDDEVRAIAVDDTGDAWIATAGGVGCIALKPMTLAEKAAYYEKEMEIIKRTEYGYTSEVGLKRPGDKSEVIHTDSDNDGLWTAMYGAGECFAYGATKDPAAKARAYRAFEALRFLQEVTQTGDIRPPKGYVARTILPTEGPDPNEGRIAGDRVHREKQDALWKVYEPRWPKSGDGKWYWKSDTSSDELDGHYFFYPAYFDYVAETEEEKERVREVVRDLTDHIIDHDFNLVDHDGTPTRWGIYNPDSLNNDANWWAERGLKSLSMLSYLAVAEHITGDPKYGEAARELSEKHHFRTNAMIYKIHFGPGSGNQSDDEMAFMGYYNLVKYTRDEELRSQIMYSFYSAWANEEPEMNPLFNFMYAACGRNVSYKSPWGEFKIQPWRDCVADAVETLIDFPLDRIDWAHKNSHRIDLQRLPRQQASEPYQPHHQNRGYRVNGKVLPVSERFFHHWNTDPWALDSGGSGATLGSGTVFLLPYYMGLCHGLIEN